MLRTRHAAVEPFRLALGHLRVLNKCDHCASRSHNLCKSLGVDTLTRLDALAVPVRIAPRGIMIHEGDPAEHFFNITSGTVRLFKLLPDGRQQITGFAGDGQFLGLAVSDTYAYGADALDAVHYCRYPRREMLLLIADFPAMKRRVLQDISNELVAAQEQMLLLGRKNARERVASFLIARMTAFPQHAHTPNTPLSVVNLPMSRRDIADYLGLAIETVSRVLGTLRRDGLIVIDDPACIRISRPAALLNLANGAE
jgi:CRP/FNR family transcriptional regulator